MQTARSCLILWLSVWTLCGCKSTQPVGTSTSPSATESRGQSSNAQQINSLYVEACTQMIRGDYQSALDLFQQVLTEDPKNHAAMYNIAKLSIEQRNYEDAIQYGTSAIEGDGENYWYYRILQQAYEFKGDYQQAITLQQEITNKFPNKIEDRLRLAELYVRNNNQSKAIEQLDLIEQKVGFNEETATRKYQLYTRNKDFEEALKTATILREYNESEPRYYQMQYETLQKLDRKEESVAILRELLEKRPEDGFALLSLADYYKAAGNFDQSDEYLYRAFSNPDIPPDGKMHIIQSLMQYVNQQPEVITRVKKLSVIFNETHPDSPDALATQGKIMMLEQKGDSARILFKEALKLSPENIDVWLDLMSTSFVNNNFDQLNKDAEEALEFFPNHDRFLFFYGISGSFLEDYPPAIHALEKIVKIGTTDLELLAQTHSELGKIYHKQEKYTKSDEQFLKALEITPEDHFILNNYAYYLSERNDQLPKAQEMIEQALVLAPERASYLDTYGWVLYQQGKFEEAEKWLKKAADKSTSSVILEHYGDALYKIGKKAEAKTIYEKAIESGSKLNLEKKLNP